MENIEEIYRKYANLIKNYIYVITNNIDLAEEIMQETFAVAIDQINKFRGECEISVWLCSIAKKILYKKTKKSKIKNTISIEELDIADSEQVEEKFIENENKLKIYKALQKLEPSTREVMLLRLTGELTFREIGEIMNKSTNWAKVTYFRGKEKLIKEELL